MGEKLVLVFKQKTQSIRWAYHRKMASRATLIGLICFVMVLSLQNNFLFMNELLICSGIIGALLLGAQIKKP